MANLALLLISIIYTLSTLSSVLSQTDGCNSCCQGPVGLPGVPGVPGSVGSNGLHGRDGFKGEAGAKGEVGETGSAGERGPPGPQGPSGVRGERGDPGLQGLPGKVGPRGIEGRPGADGQPGADGRPGSTGPKGSRGDSFQVRQSAFSVFKTSSQRGIAGAILTFNEAETNLGSHYSLDTYKFTCQIPGTYFFSFTICSNHRSDNPSVYLYKDGTSITRAYIGYTGDEFTQASQTVILQLATGNQVWLQIGASGSRIYSDGSNFTSFSGFLLYAE